MLRRMKRGEKGSISLFFAVTVLGLFTAIGLVVDGGRYLQAIETANAAAQAGARAAANSVNIASVYAAGGSPVIDPFTGAAQGNAAIAAFNRPGMIVTGSVTVPTDTTATATASASAPTVFLSLIGIHTVTGTGEAEAVIERGVTGSW